MRDSILWGVYFLFSTARWVLASWIGTIFFGLKSQNLVLGKRGKGGFLNFIALGGPTFTNWGLLFFFPRGVFFKGGPKKKKKKKNYFPFSSEVEKARAKHI